MPENWHALCILALAASSSASAVDDGACAAGRKVAGSKLVLHEPTVRVGDLFISAPVTETHNVGGREVQMRALHDELQLTYIHGLVSAEEIASLVRIADARGGFSRSPLKSQASGAQLDGDTRRTSSSCPMLWGFLYAGREEEVRAKRPELMEELELTGTHVATV